MMKKIAIAAAAVVTVTGITVAVSSDAEARRRAGNCVMMTAKGTGVGQVMAKGFAADALLDNQGQRKLKAQGNIAYKCSDQGLTMCTASQRACGAGAKKK